MVPFFSIPLTYMYIVQCTWHNCTLTLYMYLKWGRRGCNGLWAQKTIERQRGTIYLIKSFTPFEGCKGDYTVQSHYLYRIFGVHLCTPVLLNSSAQHQMNLIYRWVIHIISNIAKIFMREVMHYTEERREAVYTCTFLYKVHNNFTPKNIFAILIITLITHLYIKYIQLASTEVVYICTMYTNIE